MSLETKLKALIDSATTATVAGRVYPRRAPDPDPKATNLPVVVYVRLSTATDLDLAAAGHKQIRYRITPWANTSIEVTTISEALHAGLDYTRDLPEIDRILPDSETDRYDEDRLLYGRDVEFLVFRP